MRDWDRAWGKCSDEGFRCRLCPEPALAEPHHIVYRSLGGTDNPLNIAPLCRTCHRAVHSKDVDLLSVLSYDEQGYAASLIGIERAHRLLAPSLWREKAAA